MTLYSSFNLDINLNILKYGLLSMRAFIFSINLLSFYSFSSLRLLMFVLSRVACSSNAKSFPSLFKEVYNYFICGSYSFSEMSFLSRQEVKTVISPSVYSSVINLILASFLDLGASLGYSKPYLGTESFAASRTPMHSLIFEMSD